MAEEHSSSLHLPPLPLFVSFSPFTPLSTWYPVCSFSTPDPPPPIPVLELPPPLLLSYKARHVCGQSCDTGIHSIYTAVLYWQVLSSPHVSQLYFSDCIYIYAIRRLSTTEMSAEIPPRVCPSLSAQPSQYLPAVFKRPRIPNPIRYPRPFQETKALAERNDKLVLFASSRPSYVR